MRLGKILKKWRITNEIDLRECAKEIGITAPTLMRLENGHEPSGRTMIKILIWLIEEIATSVRVGERRVEAPPQQ